MEGLVKGLVGLAALGFVLAILAGTVMGGDLMRIPAEAFSRASTNLSLLAIALILMGKKSGA